MKKYMSIHITICESIPCLHGARIHYFDSDANVNIAYNTSYEQGMIELRKLEKLLGRPAKLTVNQYNTEIVYKELHGFLDRG